MAELVEQQMLCLLMKSCETINCCL